ncbi:unnamed protein product [Urochloa decumbens]|uniref:DUF4220 domain-containing protein n=1 Tax=Urochloa decumbens TaxID=240449 RepID=A0ABC8ZZK0_9POAL
MSFWAPFVLVHLGGQDTITAFSKQDNELWMRQHLNLVTQAAVAGYVVAKASWPDHRLRAAMVLMFLSGCFRYAERTAAIRQWISKLLGSWGFELFDVTQTPIGDDAPIKKFILNNLLHSGTRKEWNIASSCGQLAVQRWRRNHQDTDSATTGKELEKIITSGVDFLTTMLILHIATDICYFWEDEASTKSSDAQLNKHMEMSRELSNYIMYLVFKCGVMLTTNSKLLHDRAHEEISKILSGQQGQRKYLDEKEAVMKLFDAKKEEEKQDQMRVDIQKHDEEPANNYNNTGDSHMRKLVQGVEATSLPVVPRACLVAKELISINDEASKHWWGIHHPCSHSHEISRPISTTARCLIEFHTRRLSSLLA